MKDMIVKTVEKFLFISFVWFYTIAANHFRHSWSPRKRPPKVSSLAGRLCEVVAYERLDHILGQNFASLAYSNFEGRVF